MPKISYSSIIDCIMFVILFLRSVVVNDNELLNKMATKMEPILLDMLMYSDSNIVQEALNLLIIYKSQKSIYFDIADNVQIILSASLEKKCDALEASLREVKRLAEMYEVWCELHTTEDQESAANLLQCLEKLIERLIIYIAYTVYVLQVYEVI